MALGPLVTVTAYAVALFASNSTRAAISSEGVTLAHGPLPGGPPAIKIPPADIRRCYFRQARFPTIAGSIRFHAAGVETGDGRRHDLVSGFPAEHEARAAATQIAAALPEPRPKVEEALGRAVAKASFRPFVIWSAAILMSMAWVILVDVFL